MLLLRSLNEIRGRRAMVEGAKDAGQSRHSSRSPVSMVAFFGWPIFFGPIFLPKKLGQVHFLAIGK